MNFEQVKKSFTVQDARDLCGFKSTAMVDYLIRTKLVVPSIRQGAGRGRSRLLSFSNLVTLRALNKLLEKDISVRRLSNALQNLPEEYSKISPETVVRKLFVAIDGRVVLVDSDGDILDLRSKGQLVFGFVVDLQICHTDILDGIRKDLPRYDVSKEGRRQKRFLPTIR